MRPGRRDGALVFVASLVLCTHAGCGSDEKDLFTVQYDAGTEGGDGAREDAPEVDPTLGGPCTEDTQCDDQVPCTFDRCDKTLSRCRNTPDDTQCDDGEHCNGKERCILRKGCAPGPVVTCQDDNPCTIDRCIEANKSCEHLQRDSDGDGDPDDHCVGKKDCDDTDPTVSSTKVEICGNFKDDNCDGNVDEQPCSNPANDVCATALAITAPGTYLLTSVAAKKDYATKCSVKTPAAARDVVVGITVPPGGPAKDVLVRAVAHGPPNEIALALQTTCGQLASEIACANIPGIADARAIARSVAPGSTVYALITTQSESAVDLKVEMPAASTAPSNETCAAPTPVTVDVPFTVQLVDAAKDLFTGCDKSKTGELTYSFTLGASSDVRIFASTFLGSGQPVVSLRDTNCTDELRCRSGSIPPVFARSLPPGTYAFSVSGTTQIDASVLVKTYPPTPAPPNQSCGTAPDVATNTNVSIDLSNQEDAIKNDCLPGGPAAAYKLDLAVPSDVLVVGRFGLNEQGAVSINQAGCTPPDLLACFVGTTPVRVSKRNLPAGSYRIVVADELGQTAQLSVFVRPAVAPTNVTGSDGCTNAFVIPAAGGFFTGTTQTASADFSAGCDAPGTPIGGARDQLLRLDIAQPRRVVLDMIGSFYTTLIDVRKGTVCPGSEVTDLCHVGFGANRSFLDTVLTPGTHWIQVDGYGAENGPWNLDVRILPP